MKQSTQRLLQSDFHVKIPDVVGLFTYQVMVWSPRSVSLPQSWMQPWIFRVWNDWNRREHFAYFTDFSSPPNYFRAQLSSSTRHKSSPEPCCLCSLLGRSHGFALPSRPTLCSILCTRNKATVEMWGWAPAAACTELSVLWGVQSHQCKAAHRGSGQGWGIIQVGRCSQGWVL